MRLSCTLSFLFAWFAVSAVGAPEAGVGMPDFPVPTFAMDQSGRRQEAGMLRLMRELQKGGVRPTNQFNASDTSYLVVNSASVPMLAAWLESACQSFGVNLSAGRSASYDGGVYARFLNTAVSIATAKKVDANLGVPVGVMVCKRTAAWGDLPGDGQRDAYIIILSEKGLLVYDPPTRQLAPLADYPNRAAILRIRI